MSKQAITRLVIGESIPLSMGVLTVDNTMLI